MGQYYVIANLDKKEFLDPTAFGSGLKLMEFSCDECSVLTGLSILLASSNGMGGGDLFIRDSRWEDIPGRWAGDRVVVAGDYDDQMGSAGQGIYSQCGRHEGQRSGLRDLTFKLTGELEWQDISWDVIGALMEDGHVEHRINDMIARKLSWDHSAKDMWEYLRPGKPFPAKKAE